jgi:signal transduction histidine kinase
VKALYLRIWLTVVAALALFALLAGWLLQHHVQQERARAESALAERMAGWGELIQSSLPDAHAPVSDQNNALQEWGHRLRVPLALSDEKGQRIAATHSYERLEADGHSARAITIALDDGRKLRMIRPPLRFGREELMLPGRLDHSGSDAAPPLLGPDHDHGPDRGPERVPDRGADSPELHGPPMPPLGLALPGLPRDWPAGVGLLVLLAMLFVAVAAGAYPVVRGLTRRLEQLKLGVEAFGAGALGQRVDERGRDEVAAVAASFNRAAERIQSLLQSNQSLLANASHELRSPLARLKMAVTMLDDCPAAMRAGLRREVDVNIGELDSLVEEVLLSSRLEAGVKMDLKDPVDLLGLLAEEAARVQAHATGDAVQLQGSERLLRRALRNLLENAKRYGGEGEIAAQVRQAPSAGGGAVDSVEIEVCDRGLGVPEAERERIFEPFYRLSGHAEREGGVGLGLALVRQIVRRHGGTVQCLPRAGGGSCFVIRLPLQAESADQATEPLARSA